jgi:hypothetical protein
VLKLPLYYSNNVSFCHYFKAVATFFSILYVVRSLQSHELLDIQGLWAW